MKSLCPGTTEETPHALWQLESHDARPLLSSLGRMRSSESINLSGPTACEGRVTVGPSSGCQHTLPCIPGYCGAFFKLQLPFPVTCSQQPICYPRSTSSLFSPGLWPHKFAPTHKSTRQELGRDVGHQWRCPILHPADSGPCASLAQLVASLIRWWWSPISTEKQPTWKCVVIPHQPI